MIDEKNLIKHKFRYKLTISERSPSRIYTSNVYKFITFKL